MSGGDVIYGYWHDRAVDGKQVCCHYALDIGGECGRPDLGVWTPLVKQRETFAGVIADDVVWMAKLARGSSWPGEMAHAVDQAARRVIARFGSDADRAALDAES